MRESRKKRILVVDDESDITLVFKMTLEQAGFEVDVFNDPNLALAKFRPNYYDLLLLDVRMPNMNGFLLYRELQKADRKPKVCFITAFEMYYHEFVKVFPNLPVKCFVRKPISKQDLVKQVEAELGSAKTTLHLEGKP